MLTGRDHKLVFGRLETYGGLAGHRERLTPV
jgi:hypothetical protein